MGARPFVLFSAEHWAGLGVSLGLGVALVLAVRAAGSRRLDVAARWALAAACVVSEAYLALRVHQAGKGIVHLLPLHLCDVAVVLAPIVLLTGNRLSYELLYFWGLGGAMQALLTPNVTVGFPSMWCLCCFGLHALIITSALYATIVMRRRPTAWSLARAWLIANLYAALLIPVNRLMGTNYMYVLEKPRTPSLLDVMGPWPWYLVTGSVVGLLVMCLCYLPFFVLDWRRRAKAA